MALTQSLASVTTETHKGLETCNSRLVLLNIHISEYHIWKPSLWPQKSNEHVDHAFSYISLPSLHDYDVKVANFTFYRGRKHKTTTFFFFS